MKSRSPNKQETERGFVAFRKAAVIAHRYSNAVIWIADAHRGDEESFVVRADEKSTAFVELESASRACREFVLTT